MTTLKNDPTSALLTLMLLNEASASQTEAEVLDVQIDPAIRAQLVNELKFARKMLPKLDDVEVVVTTKKVTPQFFVVDGPGGKDVWIDKSKVLFETNGPGILKLIGSKKHLAKLL